MRVCYIYIKFCARFSFPFGIEGGMWDVIVLPPDHCLSIYFKIRTRSQNGYKKSLCQQSADVCDPDNVYHLETPNKSGSGCSKLTTSLVNEALKFQTFKISQICQYFLLKKCKKLLHCKSFSHFFNKNISVFGY